MFDFKQSFRLSFECKNDWQNKGVSCSRTKRSPKCSLRSWDHRMWSASWKPVLVSEARRELWWCLWPSPGPLTTWCHVSVAPVSREELLAVSPSRGETKITLYFCHSSVTSMINVESYVAQPDEWKKGLMFRTFWRQLTDEMTHVMSVISGELLDFVSLVQGKY